jgi:hypothetical protein
MEEGELVHMKLFKWYYSKVEKLFAFVYEPQKIETHVNAIWIDEDGYFAWHRGGMILSFSKLVPAKWPPLPSKKYRELITVLFKWF